MYPSITGESNIASNTQIGKIEIPHKIYKNENSYNIEGYTRSGEFIENKVTDNVIEFGHRWFHLGSVSDLVKEIEKRLDEGNIEVTDVKEPIRISYRDRFRHPVRIIGVDRPDKIKEESNK